MRPVGKGVSPVSGDFKKYEDAKPDLVSRLGLYCSYCERKITTLLAVEHIEPKELKPELEKRWSNFLLACINCNSCKGHKPVDLSKVLLPDRDNTFAAFVYLDDGSIGIAEHLSASQRDLAKETLSLVGLDKPLQENLDANQELVALDRVSQRMQTVMLAQTLLNCLHEVSGESVASVVRSMIVGHALDNGHFSIWMRVFDNEPDMKIRFIRAFKGTEASGCFDMNTGAVLTPAPNPDQLNSGGKV